MLRGCGVVHQPLAVEVLVYDVHSVLLDIHLERPLVQSQVCKWECEAQVNRPFKTQPRQTFSPLVWVAIKTDAAKMPRQLNTPLLGPRVGDVHGSQSALIRIRC